MSPHAPYLFEADGSAREMPACYPGSCVLYESNPRRLGLTHDEHGAALAAQITHLNARLLDKLARENFGISEYVRPNEDIEAHVSALYNRIGAPVTKSSSCHSSSNLDCCLSLRIRSYSGASSRK